MIRGVCAVFAVVAVMAALEPSAAVAGDQSIVIERAWARPMPPGSDVGAGYAVIHNAGDAADRLIEAVSERADRMEIHETTMADDVMRMRPVPPPLEIAPGETLEMRPGGIHIMFVGVAEPFAEGEEVPVTLTFEHGGERTIIFEIDRRPTAAPHGAEGHHGYGGQTHH